MKQLALKTASSSASAENENIKERLQCNENKQIMKVAKNSHFSAIKSKSGHLCFLSSF